MKKEAFSTRSLFKTERPRNYQYSYTSVASRTDDSDSRNSMSFPTPDYIKTFLNNKLSRNGQDSTNLLDDDALEKSTLEEVTVYKDGDDNIEGFEITKLDNHNGHTHQRTHSSGQNGETNLKTHLQLTSTGKGGYGTSDKIEMSPKDSLTRFRKAKAEVKTHEKGENRENENYYQRSTNGHVTQNHSHQHHRNETKNTLQTGSAESLGHMAESPCTSEEYARNNHSHNCTTDESDVDSEHCHDGSDEKEQTENRKRKKALKKLIIATVLSFIFMCGEILGGYLANSLAIMTDASHLLTDVSSFLVSIIALQMAAKPSSRNMTFGWHRAEVIGAITSVLAIWVVTGVLVYLAVMRLIKNEYELDGKTMLITAACAVGFNILMGLVLHESHGHHGHSHGHSHDHDHGKDDEHKKAEGSSKHSGHHDDEESGNVNVRAAFIHVLGDLLQSLGVLVAAFIIYFKPEYKIADPICTFLFSVLVLATTITILRDTIVILMEGTPAGINYEKVKEKLLAIEGVIAVHDLRIWSLTLNQCVMSGHLAVDRSVRPGAILKLATKTLKASYNFHSMTIQVEAYSLDMDDCKKCQPKKDK